MTEKRLSQYRDLLREIGQLDAKIASTSVKSDGIVKDSVSSAATFPYSKHTVVIEGIEAGSKEQRLHKKRREMLEKSRAELEELEEYISSVPDAGLRVIMRYKYIDGWTWQRIAMKMGWTDESTPRQKIKEFLNHPENPDFKAV